METLLNRKVNIFCFCFLVEEKRDKYVFYSRHNIFLRQVLLAYVHICACVLVCVCARVEVWKKGDTYLSYSRLIMFCVR